VLENEEYDVLQLLFVVFFYLTKIRDSAGAFWRPSLALLLIVSWQKEEILEKSQILA
jgi:hypothetical protein